MYTWPTYDHYCWFNNNNPHDIIVARTWCCMLVFLQFWGLFWQLHVRVRNIYFKVLLGSDIKSRYLRLTFSESILYASIIQNVGIARKLSYVSAKISCRGTKKYIMLQEERQQLVAACRFWRKYLCSIGRNRELKRATCAEVEADSFWYILPVHLYA